MDKEEEPNMGMNKKTNLFTRSPIITTVVSVVFIIIVLIAVAIFQQGDLLQTKSKSPKPGGEVMCSCTCINWNTASENFREPLCRVVNPEQYACLSYDIEIRARNYDECYRLSDKSCKGFDELGGNLWEFTSGILSCAPPSPIPTPTITPIPTPTITPSPTPGMATLTLYKMVLGGGPLDYDGFGLAIGGVPVLDGEPLTVAPGEHTVSELARPDYVSNGWELSGDCTNKPGGDGLTGTITLEPGEDKLCVVENMYIPPTTLTITKTIEGGPLVGNPNAFNFEYKKSAGDPDSIPEGVAKEVEPGQYYVTEELTGFYDTTGWGGDCTGLDPVSGSQTRRGKVTIEEGEQAECTITNVYGL